jgi:hypothetical protein
MKEISGSIGKPGVPGSRPAIPGQAQEELTGWHCELDCWQQAQEHTAMLQPGSPGGAAWTAATPVRGISMEQKRTAHLRTGFLSNQDIIPYRHFIFKNQGKFRPLSPPKDTGRVGEPGRPLKGETWVRTFD